MLYFLGILLISLIVGMLPLLVTIVVEAIVAYFCKIRSWKDQRRIVLINVATNTFINAILLFTHFVFAIYIIDFLVIIVFEVLVVIVEAKLFKLLINTPKPLKLSIILNSISCIVGDLIYLLLILNF